jgi:hypothetical protein
VSKDIEEKIILKQELKGGGGAITGFSFSEWINDT